MTTNTVQLYTVKSSNYLQTAVSFTFFYDIFINWPEQGWLHNDALWTSNYVDNIIIPFFFTRWTPFLSCIFFDYSTSLFDTIICVASHNHLLYLVHVRWANNEASNCPQCASCIICKNMLYKSPISVIDDSYTAELVQQEVYKPPLLHQMTLLSTVSAAT